MEYEVDMTSGAEIDFRDNGDWKDVKAGKGKAVPAAIISYHLPLQNMLQRILQDNQ